MERNRILVVDVGSVALARITRAVRSHGVYAQIVAHDATPEQAAQGDKIVGFIAAGGPNGVIDGVAIDVPAWLADSDLPRIAVERGASCDLPTLPDCDDCLVKALEGFVAKAAGGVRDWTMDNFIEAQVAAIRAQVGKNKVLLALSGGVDSSVVAALLLRAIGTQLYCVHVNHGLMRKGESEQVLEAFGQTMGGNLVYVDATERFLTKLAGVADPEQKRKIIGAEFIRVFEEEARKLSDIGFLGQGTIYPDIIESGTKTAKNVKSHHNVGGLPEDLKFDLVEPLAQLFKDEVRECGVALGLPREMVYRQPFPGPGLGVRCLGAITRERLELVRESDAILRQAFAEAEYDQKVWQYFTAVPDFTSVGVRDHARHMGYPCIIRAVNTVDAMTATIEPLPMEFLQSVTDKILAGVPGLNRVLYDLTPKPPATIEWE